ncbi:MAG TPA: PIN domain-containing protein, partial [Anaerolineae bacterium]|nr:PIN domain-containing protein [Anaerolineae bacterium]
MQEREALVFNPVLLPIEVAAAVARRINDPERAIELSTALRALPRQTLVAVEGALIDRAISLAAVARLRGADALYAAVAEEYGTTLVTLEAQQLERL